MQMILEHQSKFPLKIREAIAEATDSPNSSPEEFNAHVYSTLRSMLLCCKPENERLTDRKNPAFFWNGLNSDVDTEEELELAIRFFPWVLTERRDEDVYESRLPFQWLAMCLKTLPFVPVVIEMTFERDRRDRSWEPWDGSINKQNFLHSIVSDKELRSIASESGVDADPDFDRQLDEASLLVLVRLQEKGLIGEDEIWEMVDAATSFSENPSRNDMRLRFLLDWNPENLDRLLPNYYTKNILDYKKHYNGIAHVNKILTTFPTLLERGTLHYPKVMGFLFSRIYWTRAHSPFSVVSELVGEERITPIVDKVLVENGIGNPCVLLAWIFEAALNRRITDDGLYFLLRRYYVPLLSKTTTTGTDTDSALQKMRAASTGKRKLVDANN